MELSDNLQCLVYSFMQGLHSHTSLPTNTNTLTASHCHGLYWGAVLAKHLLRIMGANTELVCAERLQSRDDSLCCLTGGEM